MGNISLLKDSDYTVAEKVTMFALLTALIAVNVLTWFVGADGWPGWLGVVLIIPGIIIALRARRRVRRSTVPA